MALSAVIMTSGVALAQPAPAPVVGPQGVVPNTPPGGETNRPAPEAEEPATRRADLSGPLYTVLQFTVSYARPNPGLPELEALETRRFPLGFVEGRWVAPSLARDYGGSIEMVSLAELNEGDGLAVGDFESTRAFHFTAVDAILDAVRGVVNDAGFIGIRTIPDPGDITIQGEDLRSSADEPVNILVLTAEVTASRTIASGERIDEEERINNPAHARIAADSPLQATPEGAEVANPASLLQKENLDRYLFQLNRHPGRRVDVAVSALEEPGEVQLDYLVNENKPWVLYYQLTNTGTETTEEWRHRVGYVHNQLTGNDDILNVDYIFSSLDIEAESQALLASYEAPLFTPRLRGRIHGFWTRFDASEIGAATEDFTGETFGVDARLEYNFYQRDNLFLDFMAGVEYRDVEVTNEVVVPTQTGDADFLIPYIGVAAEMVTDTTVLVGDFRVMYNPNITDVEVSELTDLGRIDPSETWVILRLDSQYSFYLEPLLFNDAWLDPSTPESSTLAHEMVLKARGQYGGGNRIVPQYEAVLGGLYSVRGYPESLVAGDNSLFLSAEYRYHLPRALPIDRTPDHTLFGEPFRVQPQEVYAQPDWDLILKAFVDGGIVMQQDSTTGEIDDELLGAGIGIGFLFKQNLSIDVDWGFALTEAQEGRPQEVEVGDSEVHVSLTILY
ncbi:hypothetical protein [Mucisphaera sp.]|uniref:hypothetical protein n=1 Tax=Mucisphaera sp. TaxID=2913024 RepID=UPI003D0FE369